MNNNSTCYICSECKSSYYYFDSPPADRCFCGALLRKPTEEEMVDIINRETIAHIATCSC